VAHALDVLPHPHIGLSTVSYLFGGQVTHRDSLGVEQVIRPGEVNWMTAGRGIAHSERTPEEVRRSGGTLHGIQIWIALPKEHEQTAPAFEHHPAATLPKIALPGVHMTLIAGSAFGQRAPATTFSDMFYIAAEMDAGSRLMLPTEYRERTIYAVDADIRIDGSMLDAGHMAMPASGQEITIEAATACRVMLLGGEPLDGDRFIWWNFVASSKEAIADAKERWRQQRFDPIPGETERIPLPDEPVPAESFS